MQNIHINKFESIIVGKTINSEIIIENNFLTERERVIKTVYQTTANSEEKVNSLKIYILNNKILHFFGSHNITEQQYSEYLNSIPNKN